MQNDYIINYETGEVKNVGDIRRLKDIENLDEVEEIGDNIILSSSDSLAVEEGLILNIDSSVIDGDVANEQEALQERLGEGVELVNFDYNDESGLTPTSFNFDGVNDYIKILYNDSLAYHADGTAYMGTDGETGEERQLTQKEVLAQNGFTFEFYGIFDKGRSFWNGEEQNSAYAGLLGYWSKYDVGGGRLRFGLQNEGTQFVWNGGMSASGASDFTPNGASSPYPWTQVINLGYDLWDGRSHHLVVSLDVTKFYKEGGNGKYYCQKVYLDGKNIATGGYNVLQWVNFCEVDMPNCVDFRVGMCSMNAGEWWHYSKLSLYTARLYSRGLSEDEILNGYITDVVYHQFLEKLYK